MNVGTKKGFSWDNDNDHDRTPVGRPALSLISVGVQRRNGTVDVGGSGCWGKGNKQTRTNGTTSTAGRHSTSNEGYSTVVNQERKPVINLA